MSDRSGGWKRKAARGSLRLPSIAPLLRLCLSRVGSRVATVVGLACIAAFAATLGAAFLLLSNGPVSFSWLAPRVVQSLQEIAGPRYGFELGNAAVANTSHGPTLSVDGLIVKYDGRPVLAAPRAEMSVDFSSLLVGRLKPRRIEALDLEVRLSVNQNGAVAISAGAEPLSASPPPVAPPVASPSESMAGGPSPPVLPRATLLRQAVIGLRGLMDLATSPQSAIGALDRVAVSHGRLIVEDRTTDRTVRYEDVALALDKGAGGMRFSLSARGPARRWSALAVAKGAPGGKRSFNAQLRDFSIDEIAFLGGFRNARFDMDAPLGADLDFALGTDDAVLDAGGRFEIGKGFFRLDEPDHEPVMIDRIAGEAKWDKGARRLVIAPLRFNAGGFDMSLAGEARPAASKAVQDGAPQDGQLQDGQLQDVQPQDVATQAATPNAADAWNIVLRLDKPTIVVPERAGEKPIRIDSGRMNAWLLHRQRKLKIDAFTFDGPDTKIDFGGAVSWGEETRVAFKLGAVDTQLSALARLWPTHVAAPVRAWFVDHVRAGLVKRATYTADFDGSALTGMRYERAPPDPSVLLEADIVGGAVADVLPGMAPITGIDGQLRVTGRTALFAATSGFLETGPGRRLTLSEGRFIVPDFLPTPAPATVEARVAGGVDAVADILALPSIAAHAGLPVDPATLKGQTEGRVRVDFEMGKGAREDKVAFAVDANATGLSVDRLLGKEKLDNATLNVQADNAHVHVTGQGTIYGAPATLDLRRATGEKTAQAQLTLTFDDAARQRAGYGAPGVSGPVAATIRTPVPANDINARVELDLTRTALDNPLPGVVKPAGRAAKASFTIAKRSDGGVGLDQISVDAGAAQAQGAVELTKDGAFRAARLSQLRLSPGDDLRVDVTRGAEGVKVVARGVNFDARPMLQSVLHAGEKASAKGALDDVEIELKSPVVTGHNKQILANVDFKMERRGGKPRALSLTGLFGREQLSVALARNQNGAPQVDITTNDGGSFLAFLDLYRKMDNGALSASVQLSGDNRADGAMRIRDFYVRGEPTVRQLMAQGGAMRADDRGVAHFDPDLVRVGRLQSDFSWSAGRLSLREGVMSGPEIGLTFDGYIDFPRDRLDLSGAYVPAYALNSLLSNIPVLGVVLAGGQHEGIFALNYRVTGAMSAPVVNVNPLSAMAPGLLRKIMGVLDGTARAPNGR